MNLVDMGIKTLQK